MDRRGFGRFIIPLYILLTAILLMGAFDVFYSSESYFRMNNFIIGDTPVGNECNDYDECTVDYVLIDGSCIHRPKKINSSCNKDVCYGNATNKRCCDDGTCISNRYNCIGICPNVAVPLGTPLNCTIDLFPLNYAQFNAFYLTCLYSSCTLTTIQFQMERMALDESYLYNISSCNRNVNFAKSKCIQHQCSIIANNSVVCTYRYRCASFVLGNNLINSKEEEDNASSLSSSSFKPIVHLPSFGDQMDVNNHRKMLLEYNKGLLLKFEQDGIKI